jgi:HPr kinase/phosphorylase
MSAAATIHASAVLVGARAVLIRGRSGSGKSRLALALIEAGRSGTLPFTRLVADDRVAIEPVNGRVLARPAAMLAGLIEVRGLGLRRLPYEPVAVVGHVVDLDAEDPERMPAGPAMTDSIAGIALPRLAVAPGADPLPGVLVTICTQEAAPHVCHKDAGPAQECFDPPLSTFRRSGLRRA